MKRARALALLVALALVACAGNHGGPGAPADAVAPRGWYEQSVDESRDLVVMLRPRALAEDKVYGPIFRRASQIAAAHAKGIKVGTTTLEAFEGAEDLVLAVRDERGGDLDAVVVVGGVPSGVDPARVVDTDGQPLWRVLSEKNPRVTELMPTGAGQPARLFVLPDRTWIIGVGDGALRVGAALSRAEITPYLPAARAPIVIKLRGEILDRIRAHARSGLAPIAARLVGVNLSLTSGGASGVEDGAIAALFTYADARAASVAEARAREVIDALAEKLSPRLDFMRAAEIKRGGASVELRARLPPAVLRRFAEAGDAVL